MYDTLLPSISPVPPFPLVAHHSRLALHTSMAEFTYRRCISFQTQKNRMSRFSLTILSWSLGRKLTGPLRLGRHAPRNGEGRDCITPSNQKRLPTTLFDPFVSSHEMQLWLVRYVISHKLFALEAQHSDLSTSGPLDLSLSLSLPRSRDVISRMEKRILRRQPD